MKKGKPSGKYAENKSRPGRKGDYKRGAWPEEMRHQHIVDGEDPRGARRRQRPQPQSRLPSLRTLQGRARQAPACAKQCVRYGSSCFFRETTPSNS